MSFAITQTENIRTFLKFLKLSSYYGESMVLFLNKNGWIVCFEEDCFSGNDNYGLGGIMCLNESFFSFFDPPSEICMINLTISRLKKTLYPLRKTLKKLNFSFNFSAIDSVKFSLVAIDEVFDYNFSIEENIQFNFEEKLLNLQEAMKCKDLVFTLSFENLNFFKQMKNDTWNWKFGSEEINIRTVNLPFCSEIKANKTLFLNYNFKDEFDYFSFTMKGSKLFNISNFFETDKNFGKQSVKFFIETRRSPILIAYNSTSFGTCEIYFSHGIRENKFDEENGLNQKTIEMRTESKIVIEKINEKFVPVIKIEDEKANFKNKFQFLRGENLEDEESRRITEKLCIN